MFEALGKIIVRRPYLVIGCWLLLAIGAAVTGQILNAHFSAGGFTNPNSESAAESHLLSQAFRSQYPQSLIVVIKRPDLSITSPGFQATVKAVAAKLARQSQIGAVASSLANPMYARKDSSVAFLTVGLKLNETDAQNYVPDMRQVLAGMPELKAYQQTVTGAPALAFDLNKTTQLDLEQAEMMGVPVMLVILLLVFGTCVAGILPLLIGGTAIVIALSICDMLALHFQISLLVSNAVSMLGLGVAVDYALFVVSRFREELLTRPAPEAAVAALGTAGRAVVASGATVVASLAALALPPIMIFRSIALGGTIVVALAVLSAITLLPALLSVLGQRVNALPVPFSARRVVLAAGQVTRVSLWERWTRFILRRPVISLCASLLLLAVIAVPALALQMRVPVAASGILPASAPSRIGYETLTRSIGAGTLFPVDILVQSNEGPITDSAGLNTITRITNTLAKEADTAQIISLSNWNSSLTEAQNLAAIANFHQLPAGVQQALTSVVNINGDARVARILVLPRSGPDDEATYQLVQRIRADLQSSVPGNYTALVGGATAGGLDFDRQVRESIPQVILLVFCITLIVLFLTFRSLLLPLKALALNSLVTIASLGALVAIFQYGWLFNWGTRGAINSVTPPILFAVLFGLSMDYEVFILSRIKETFERTRDNASSVIEGLTQTAPMVTGGAAIMIAVFGAFSLVQLEVVKELGFGLTVAILLDATVVRVVLVPVTMKLFGDWNWWLPTLRLANSARSLHIGLPIAPTTPVPALAVPLASGELNSLAPSTLLFEQSKAARSAAFKQVEGRRGQSNRDVLQQSQPDPAADRHELSDLLFQQFTESLAPAGEEAPARLLTVGVQTGAPGTEHIASDAPFQLNRGDLLLVDGRGDRLAWTGRGEQRQLAGILPTLEQQREIRTFLGDGGTVLTFPADPAVASSLALYREEIPKGWPQQVYPTETVGDHAEVSVRPFDWLPQEIEPALREAFELFSRDKASPLQRWEPVEDLRILRCSTIQVIAIPFGRGTLVVCRDCTVALQFSKNK